MYNVAHKLTIGDLSQVIALLVQDNIQEGSVDVETAFVVFNEPEFPEFIHEEIDPAARCPDHPRQHLLRYFGKHLFRVGLLAVPSEQQKSPSQSLLGGVKELIDQILLDADIPHNHISHEAVGERMFSVEHANHLFLFNNK